MDTNITYDKYSKYIALKNIETNALKRAQRAHSKDSKITITEQATNKNLNPPLTY